MENQEQQKVEQTGKCFLSSKKKVAGIPIVLVALLGIGMVFAAGTFFYLFSQDVTVHGIIHPSGGGGPTQGQIIPLVITGDLHPILLNCTAGTYCYTSNISIWNPTIDNQTVAMVISFPGSAIDVIAFQGEVNNTSLVLAPNQTVTFRVGYHIINNTADTQFDSHILVTSNMTQY